jgi:tetratricopeptide (TPR) repeat protein
MAPPREASLPVANRVFVDREEPQRIFEKAAFSIPADRALIRVFYGVGGQGKTALCRELMRKTDVSIEPSYAFLRRALLDLHGRPKTDPDLLLVWIRNAFAEAGLFMPCFDLALAEMWQGTRGEEAFPVLTKPWLARSTKAATGALGEGATEIQRLLGSETATQLFGEAIGEIPGLKFLIKGLGGWIIDKSKRAYLEHTREPLQRLYKDGELRRPHELSSLLPWMLAQDLNYHLSRHPTERFVLFIDEYERVFDQGGAGARWVENPFDAYLRVVIRETNGLLAVLFTRERLPWSDHPEWRDDLKGNQYLLGGLADEDADDFLRLIPIADAAVRAAIIDGARERPGTAAGVYPLMLDLQVEHWRSLAAKGQVSPGRFTVTAATFEARCIEIVESVLRDYDIALQTTIERLSVTRRFDRSAFNHVVTTFGTALPLDNFDRIADLSFVTKTDDGFLALHNIVASAIRATLTDEKRRTSLTALFEHFSSRAQVVSHFEMNAEKMAALFEASQLKQSLDIAGFVEWLSEAADPLRMAALYAPAAWLWRDALYTVEKALGAEHPATSTSLNNLAYLLEAQGEYAAAKPFYERALEISEKALGAEHPSTGTSLNNLAGLLGAQGDYAAARPLYERALAIRERALGAEHPDTGASLNNLAGLFRAQGDYAAAKPLYERALAISEKALGAEHPATGTSLNNLASLLAAQGDHAAAKPLYERALAISEKALGAEHPATGASLNNLAGLLGAQGDYAAAKPLYERALAISEKALGAEHPATGASLNNLAGLLGAQGDYAAAKPLYERALAIRERALGAEHPSTNIIRENLNGLGKR